MITQEIKAAQIAMFQAIASVLGASFENMDMCDQDRGHITMPDGVRFFVITGGYSYKGKVHVSPSYPQYISNEHGGKRSAGQRDFDHSLHYPDTGFDGINISSSKTPEQIAKDIQRRFLPVYVPLYAQAVAYCEKQAAYWKNKTSLDKTARDLIKPISRLHLDYVSESEVTVKVSGLDADKLQRLCEFLKTI
jgi:hypothetical protein